MIKVIRHKTRIAAAHGRFSHIRQVALMCTPYRKPKKVAMATSISTYKSPSNT